MFDSSPPNRERKEWPPEWTFEPCYAESYSDAFGLAYKLTGDFQLAEEVVQDAAVALNKKMDRGERVTRAEYLTIVRNKAIDAFRAKIRRRKLGVSESDFDIQSDDNSEEVPFLSNKKDENATAPGEVAKQVGQIALLALMHSYLKRVYPAGAEVFLPHKIEGHSQAETAALLGVPENTVKQRSKKSCDLLRTRFRAEFDALND